MVNIIQWLKINPGKKEKKNKTSMLIYETKTHLHQKISRRPLFLGYNPPSLEICSRMAELLRKFKMSCLVEISGTW